MSTINVHDVDVMAEGVWAFRAESIPQWRPKSTRGHASDFDPFPAYAHQRTIIDDAVRHVLGCWTPAWDVDLYNTNREEVARSNGHSALVRTGQYEPCTEEHDDGLCGKTVYVKNPISGMIVLSGKRIPPIPPMTRYLVAHEYGHNVEWMINAARGAENPDDETLMGDYVKVRGLDESALHHGSGGRWHDSAAEIFACDFRIIVCGVLEDSWPHPGTQRPEVRLGLERWWADVKTELDA